jgi:hypothetical protein
VAIAQACGHDILRPGYWRWRIRPTKKINDLTFLFGDPDKSWYTQTYRPEIELLVREDGGVPLASTPASDDVEEEWLQQLVQKEEEALAALPPSPEPSPNVVESYRRYPDYLLKIGTETVYVGLEDTRDLMAVALWPDLYAQLLMARARRYAAEIPGLKAAGMEVNFAGMDFCSNEGPSISPATFHHVVLPALKLLVDTCHSHGVTYFYGGDGNFWVVAEDMFNGAGVDGWFELDKSAGMDLRKLRARFPQVTLIGNIRVQVLHTGTLDDVQRETMECLNDAHELRRIIVGCSNMIMPGTPPENIHLMLKLIEENR